jgi:hypothetical protein
MLRITNKKVCPSCGVVDFTRKHRSAWMRLLRGSRLYQCRHCRDHILLLNEQDAEDEVRLEEA